MSGILLTSKSANAFGFNYLGTPESAQQFYNEIIKVSGMANFEKFDFCLPNDSLSIADSVIDEEEITKGFIVIEFDPEAYEITEIHQFQNEKEALKKFTKV